MLPYALLWGVPYDVFFLLNPQTIRPFEKSYRIKCEDEAEAMNHSAWLIGRYVCASIAACFGKKQYPERPFESKANADDGDGESYEFSDAQRFEAFAITYNLQHKEKSEKNNQLEGAVM